MNRRERWPDVEYDDQRGIQITIEWTHVGAAAEFIEFAFPEWGPTPGNDYPNVIHFIKEKSGLDPSVPLSWDPSNVEWQEDAA